MQIAYLNGERFSRALKAASFWLSQKQQKLNDINVFPVPDSDTGTNMAATMESIARSIENRRDANIEEVSGTVAELALSGARGNSGVILAQFFFGLAEGFHGKFEVTTKHFSDAIHRAVKRSYEALTNPKEGTILTVMKDWGEYVRIFSKKTKDFHELLFSSLKVAERSVDETPKKMKILAKAGVVDAGALGFLFMLEGITDFITRGKIRTIKSTQISPQTVSEDISGIDFSLDQITYRYCTEFYLSGKNISASLLRRKLQDFGDSLIVAGSGRKVRIHIHTSNPRDVFDFVNQYGEIVEQKVDDMFQQHIDAFDKSKKKKVVLVTDSSCDLPDELLKKFNIHVIPLRVYLDDTEYIDKVTLKPEEFYERLSQAKQSPKTSQPTPNDFLRVYQQLIKHYETILSIHISSVLSGTYQSALLAARKVSDIKIRVIDSKTISTTLGLIMQAAGEAVNNGVGVEDLVKYIGEWIQSSKLFVSVSTLDFLIKGGRLSRRKGFLANLLKLTPILSVNDKGKLEKVALSKRGLPSRKKLIKLVLQEAKKMSKPHFAIVQVNAQEIAEWYLKQLLSHYNQEEISIMPLAPVIGAHTGPGAAAVSILDFDVSTGG